MPLLQQQQQHQQQQGAGPLGSWQGSHLGASAQNSFSTANKPAHLVEENKKARKA
jgi:hypothetical protein